MNDEWISIDVKVDTGDSAAALRAVSGSLKDTGKSAAKAAPEVDLWGDVVDEAGDAAKRTALSAAAAERRIKALGNEALKSAGKLMAFIRVQRRAESASGGSVKGGGAKGGGGGRGRKGISGGVAGGSIIAMASRFGSIAYLIAGVLPALATGISSLGAGIAGLAGALAPLSGLLVAYPGYLAAVGQAFIAVKMSMSGFGDVWKEWSNGASTIQKVNQGLARFTGGGINKSVALPFVESLGLMREQFKYIGYAVQRTVLPAMTQLSGVGRSLMPVLTKGLIGTGTAIGNIIRDISGYLGTGRAKTLIDSIFGTNTSIIATFGASLKPITSMLLELINAAGPMLKQIASDITGFFTRMSAKVTEGAGNGGLAQFFKSAYDAAKAVLNVVLPLTQGLMNIMKIGKPLGDALLASWGSLASKFLEFTKSAEGVEKISGWFEYMTPILYEVGYLVMDIAKAVASLTMSSGFIELSQTIRKQLLPVIVEFIKSTAEQLLPVLLQAATAVIKLLTAWQGASATIIIIKTLTGLLEILVAMIERTNGVVSNLIAAIFAIWVAVKAGKIAVAVIMLMTKAFTTLRLAALGSAAAIRSIRLAFVSTGIGIIIVAIGLIAEKIMSANEAADDATQANKDWAASIFEVNGALSSQAAIMTAQDLKQKGAFQLANQMGIAGDVLVKAAMNDKAALDQIKSAYENLYAPYAKLLEEAKRRGSAQGVSNIAARIAGDKDLQRAKQLLDIIDPMASAFVAEGEAAKYAAQASGTWGKTMDEVNGIGNSAVGTIDGVANATLNAASATERLNRSLQTLRGLLDRREAMRNYRADLRSLRKTLRENGAIFNTSAKGDANTAAVDSIIGKALDRAQGFIDANNKPQALKVLNNTVEDITSSFQSVFGKKKGKEYADKALKPIIAGLENVKAGLNSVTTAEAGVAGLATGGSYVGSMFVPGGMTAPSAATTTTTTGGSYVGSMFVPGTTSTGAAQGAVEQKVSYTLQMDAATLKNAEVSSNTLKSNLVWFAAPPHTLTFLSPTLMAASSEAARLKFALEEINNSTYRSVVEITTKINGAKGQRYAGGPVTPGKWLVGELGPEGFMDSAGRLSIVGARGPEVKDFATSGTVIPNHELVSAMASQLRDRPTRMSNGEEHSGGVQVHIGSISQASEFDVVQAVKRGIIEAERNRRERS